MKTLPAEELTAAIEAIVFVASEPVKRETLAALFPDVEPGTLDAAIDAVVRWHASPGRGLLVDRVAGGLRLATRPDVHHHVIRFVQKEKAERLSLRTLETLAVIAYKQPVTAAEVQEIRGVDPSGTIKTLLDRSLIKVVGRKKVVGRPFVYGTTTTFLTVFGLNDLTELPTLKEIEEFGDFPATDLATIEPLDADAEATEPAQDDGGSAGDERELGAPPRAGRSRRSRARAEDAAP